MESIVLTLSIKDIFANLKSIKQLLLDNDLLLKKFNDMVLRQYVKIITIRKTVVLKCQLDIIETKLIKFGEKLDKLQKDISQGQNNILMRDIKPKKSFSIVLAVDNVDCDEISEITAKIKIMFYLFFFVYILDEASIDKTLILEQDAELIYELYSQLKYWETINPKRTKVSFDIFFNFMNNLRNYLKQRGIINRSLILITELTVKISLEIVSLSIDSEKNCLEVWNEITSPLSSGINIRRLKFHIDNVAKKLNAVNILEKNLKILNCSEIRYNIDSQRILELFKLVSDVKQNLTSFTALATKRYAEISNTSSEMKIV